MTGTARESWHLQRGGLCRTLAIALLLALGAALLPAAPARAQTVTWTGLAGNNWSIGGNWSTGTPPTTGDDVVLTGGVAPASIYDLGSSRGSNPALRSITLSPSPSSYAIIPAVAGTDVLALQSGGAIVSNSAAGPADSINIGVTLNGPATFTLSAGAGSTLSFNRSITGTGPLMLVSNSMTQLLALQAANTYTGATTVSGSGTVLFGVNGAVPIGSALTVDGQAAFSASSTVGSLAGSGSVLMSGNNTLTVGGDNTSTTFLGQYFNSGGAAALTKTGMGTLTLSGSAGYTGATTVSGGTLLVNGNLAVSAVTVNAGATLGGTGTTGALTTSGIVSPGLSGPGILTTGNATFHAPSAFSVNLNGTTAGSGYDRLNVSGAVNLIGATLNASLGPGFTPTFGDSFTIIQSTAGISGTFTGLANGATLSIGGRTFTITYGPNSVVLTDTSPPTHTPTRTPTATSTPTSVPTLTSTATATGTGTPTASGTPTGTPLPTLIGMQAPPTATPTPPLVVPTNQNLPPLSGQPGVACTSQAGGICTITGPNEDGTWTRTGSGTFLVAATGPAGTLVGSVPAIFLPTTAGVEGFACSPVTAARQTTCVGTTVGNLLQGATVTVRFAQAGGGTAPVTGTVSGSGAPAAAAPAAATLLVPLLPALMPPLGPPPVPPLPFPALWPVGPMLPAVQPEVPIIPEADSLLLLAVGLTGLGLLVRPWRRRG